ncbi:nuclease-like protein [Roseibium hamelinense]|uniref:Nuclease-like protein n=2 Tax=Roseibium hamelinense TaxID=150831 RepID=A0A562SLB8_9HYPH|nr:nuclease-like protein [Roseibium hamelinense]
MNYLFLEDTRSFSILGACLLLLGVFVRPVDADQDIHACLPNSIAMAVYGPDGHGVFADEKGALYVMADVDVPTQDSPKPLTASKQVFAYPANANRDRWGRQPVWVVLSTGERKVLLQELLLRQGSAVFVPRYGSYRCHQQLRKAEASARQKELGIWADNGMVHASRHPARIEAHSGRYVLIEGRLVSLGKTRSTRYLNFGRHWKTDLTVTWPSRLDTNMQTYLKHKGMSLSDLAGRALQIRGVVGVKDGPYIEIEHPGQLHVLDRERKPQ